MTGRGRELGVTYEYVNVDHTEWLVDYGAKRKARYKLPMIGEINEAQGKYLGYAAQYAVDTVNPKSLVDMSDVNVCRLVERLARSFCGGYSPRASCDLPKSVIRWVILDTLQILAKE